VLQWFSTLQLVVLAGILLVAGTIKLAGRSASTARRSAAARFVNPDFAEHFYRVVGAAEVVVAAALLVPPAHIVAAWAAAGLAVGFTGYLAYSRATAPGSSCGCVGSREAPIDARAFGRAGLMVVLGAVGALGSASWPAALAGRSWWSVAVLAVEAACVVALSPEFDHRWLVPLRRLRVRLSHPLAGNEFTVPVESTVHQLQRSPAYRAVASLLRSDLLESWDEDGWRVLTYRARTPSHDATAVFAVRLVAYEPDTVRAVLTDDDQAVLWRWSPEPDTDVPVEAGTAAG
jgi:DoxX-like family